MSEVEPYGESMNCPFTSHILWGYGCANALVKMDCQQHSILKVYDPCPSFVYPTFVWDMKHLGTSRMWDLNSFGLAIV